jgi:outer membrane immunogenic protein
MGQLGVLRFQQAGLTTMKRLVLGVAAALMLTAGQAAADGLPSKGRVKAPEAATPTWSGFYVGVGVGAGAVVHDLTVTQQDYCGYDSYCPALSAPSYGNSFNFDGIGGEGIFGTIAIGYDHVIRPGWVGGVFADYDFSGISTDISLNGEGLSLDHTSSWSVGGRLGVLVNPTTLLYGAAGYTQAEFDFGPLGSPTFSGYFVGAGIETFLRQSLTLKLEYRFSQFDSENLLEVYGTRVDLEPSMHSARLVLSYKLPHHD